MAKIAKKKKITEFPKIFVRLPVPPGSVYEREIPASIRGRRRGAVVYRYLQFRDGARVRSFYLGSVRINEGD